MAVSVNGKIVMSDGECHVKIYTLLIYLELKYKELGLKDGDNPLKETALFFSLKKLPKTLLN